MALIFYADLMYFYLKEDNVKIDTSKIISMIDQCIYGHSYIKIVEYSGYKMRLGQIYVPEFVFLYVKRIDIYNLVNKKISAIDEVHKIISDNIYDGVGDFVIIFNFVKEHDEEKYIQTINEVINEVKSFIKKTFSH